MIRLDPAAVDGGAVVILAADLETEADAAASALAGDLASGERLTQFGSSLLVRTTRGAAEKGWSTRLVGAGAHGPVVTWSGSRIFGTRLLATARNETEAEWLADEISMSRATESSDPWWTPDEPCGPEARSTSR